MAKVPDGPVQRPFDAKQRKSQADLDRLRRQSDSMLDDDDPGPDNAS